MRDEIRREKIFKLKQYIRCVGSIYKVMSIELRVTSSENTFE